MKAFDDLLQTMNELRLKCPWDQKQSISSLRPYLLEEAYESLDAMNRLEAEGPLHLIEELGDLLLQIVFQARILQEEYGSDVIERIITGINDKMIRRHPHVFAEATANSSQEVEKNWEAIKKTEGKSYEDPMDKPLIGTALQQAEQIGKQSKKVGFDWASSAQVFDQVQSELQELKEACSAPHKEEELGDLLFTSAQWARHESIDPEVALAGANRKFLKRYQMMLQISQLSNTEFSKLSIDQKESYWKQAKVEEKRLKENLVDH